MDLTEFRQRYPDVGYTLYAFAGATVRVEIYDGDEIIEGEADQPGDAWDEAERRFLIARGEIDEPDPPAPDEDERESEEDPFDD